jgi:hypothetical protein
MDDARIRQLAEEVLSQLATPAEPSAADLETRVAALEVAVRELQQRRPIVAAAHAHVHPALQALHIGGEGGGCVLEPDKPCVNSGQCRALGH